MLDVVGVAPGLDQHIALPVQRSGVRGRGGRLEIDFPHPFEVAAVEMQVTGEAFLARQPEAVLECQVFAGSHL